MAIISYNFYIYIFVSYFKYIVYLVYYYYYYYLYIEQTKNSTIQFSIVE